MQSTIMLFGLLGFLLVVKGVSAWKYERDCQVEFERSPGHDLRNLSDQKHPSDRRGSKKPLGMEVPDPVRER